MKQLTVETVDSRQINELPDTPDNDINIGDYNNDNIYIFISTLIK
jgi:hypothetical protein